MKKIVVDNISKTYILRKRNGGFLRTLFTPERSRVEALREISFELEQGELLGYIGPNGAGKSTTIKILTGILAPDSGACSVLGMTPWRERVGVVSRVGVVFGQRSQLWWDLPVLDSFTLLRDLYRVDARTHLRVRDELVERLDLAALLSTPVRQLSLGQRMRCELAASLLHAPEILFLDEPTIGLDAVSKLAVRDFIREQNRARGMTVILTTHDMDDIEALCTRVLLIGHGRILKDGSVQSLLDERHERRIIASLERPLDPETLPEGVAIVTGEGVNVTLRFDPLDIPAASLITLLNERCGIQDVMVENPPIDEVIAKRYAQLDGGQP